MGDGVPGLTGWRWRGTLALLAVATALDLLVTLGGGSPVWWVALALSAAVAGLAVRALRTDSAASSAASTTAVVLSLLGSTGLGVAATVTDRTTGFGFLEGTALTFLLVACWRRATGGLEQVLTGAVAMAVVVLPLRLGLTTDVVSFSVAAVAVTAVAVATGSTLRATDASHQATVTAVRRAEREEVARELHDVVAHHVTGMVVLTQAARTTAARGPTRDAAQLDDALAAVERAGGEALVSLRSMVAVLRQPDGHGGAPRAPMPTVDDLEELVCRFRVSGTAVDVGLALAPGARALPPEVQASLHRVVQESLTNVSRYARGASTVNVDLTLADGRAVLTVADSGGRTDPAFGSEGTSSWGGGFGILGMQGRVAAVGGSLSAGPGAGGHGWVVRAELPA